MEISHIYGKVLVNLPASRTPTAPFRSRSLSPRLSTAADPLHSQLTNFLFWKLFRLLGRETQIVQEGQKQTFSTGTKLDNGRGRF